MPRWCSAAACSPPGRCPRSRSRNPPTSRSGTPTRRESGPGCTTTMTQLLAQPGRVRAENRRRPRLRAQLPGVQRRQDDGRQRQPARHAEQHDEPRDDHDRRQRRRLQHRDHRLRGVLLHLPGGDQQRQRVHPEPAAGAARHDLQRHPLAGRRRRTWSCSAIRTCSPATGRRATSTSLTSDHEKQLNGTADRWIRVVSARADGARVHLRRPAQRVPAPRGLLVVGVAERPVESASASPITRTCPASRTSPHWSRPCCRRALRLCARRPRAPGARRGGRSLDLSHDRQSHAHLHAPR